MRECGANSTISPCLAKTYNDNPQAAIDLALKQAPALIGYSERLFYVLDTRSEKVFVRSVPLGPAAIADHSFIRRRPT
jgi:hypothetical protein